MDYDKVQLACTDLFRGVQLKIIIYFTQRDSEKTESMYLVSINSKQAHGLGNRNQFFTLRMAFRGLRVQKHRHYENHSA